MEVGRDRGGNFVARGWARQGLLQDEVPGTRTSMFGMYFRGVVLRYESTPIGQEGQIVAGDARQHQLVLVVDTVASPTERR